MKNQVWDTSQKSWIYDLNIVQLGTWENKTIYQNRIDEQRSTQGVHADLEPGEFSWGAEAYSRGGPGLI